MIVSIKSLSKTYSKNLNAPVKVLDKVNLNIKNGDFVCLMGPSGSGKSTLLNLIGLLDIPTNGSIFFKGKEISTLSPNEKAKLRNRSFGFVFQGFNLLKRTSVIENVMLPLLYKGISRKDAMDEAKKVLELTGINEFETRLPSQLSGGQQQRVAISRALIVQPELILADEPTGNLDSKTAKQIMNVFSNLNKNHKITLILVTHEQEIASYGKRIIKMLDGSISSEEII